MTQPQYIELTTMLAIIALSLILAAMFIKGAVSASMNLRKSRAARIDTAVFDSLLPAESRVRISELPTTQTKHEALEQEYARLMPAQNQQQAQETIKYYLTRHGSNVNVPRKDLQRRGGYAGYTDDGGAFVPLYAGGWGDFGGGSHDGGGFFDGGSAGDGGGGDGGSGGGGGD